ncbi:MAG: diguanylate cyclase [bacterium]
MNPKQKALDEINKQQQSFIFGSSNPILGAKAPKIEPKKSANKLYGGYNSSTFSSISIENPDPIELLNNFCSATKYKKSSEEIFSCLHNIAINQLNLNFISIGFINPSLNSINLNILDKINNTYAIKVSLDEIENPIIDAMNSKSIKFTQNIDFLNIYHLKNTPTIIIPLISKGEHIGVLLAGSENLTNQKVEILKLLSEFATIYMQNLRLNAVASQKVDQDSLTGLKNHRCFQDELQKQIKIAKTKSQSLSVIIFDINDIARINRELGHARGDEIIKYISQKIKENIRPKDIAARYGGDEIAIILPDTDNAEAIYMAEYLCYTATCNPVNDEKINLSIGIANYPNCSSNQEKLLLLAEQATVISKHNNYKDCSLSNIVSANDIDFWDGAALKSFASVISKRHAELGINFEDEIINQFQAEKIESTFHLVEIATSLSGAIEAKDTYTKGHSRAVSIFSERLAKALKLSDKEIQNIKLGALLHDVGKIGIPENILRKSEELNEEEWNILKQHPSIGVKKVLKPIEILKDLIPIVEHHHENWDGSGYPAKLKGEEIPLGARIVAVADAYHALISDRPYRKGLEISQAIQILHAGAGIQWEKSLVMKFIELIPEISTTI